MIDFHALQHCQTCRMQEHLLTSQLTPALRQELHSLAFRVSLPSGATVFQESHDANGIFILRKGLAKVAMTSELGRIPSSSTWPPLGNCWDSARSSPAPHVRFPP
jgi:hypothetical protein